MKIYKITESYTGYVDYVIKANSKEEAMKLYKDNLDNCTEIDDDLIDTITNFILLKKTNAQLLNHLGDINEYLQN